MLGLPGFGLEESEEDDEPDTPVSRFIIRLNNFVLKGFVAKDKNIRLRSVNVVSELIAHLGELEYVAQCISCTQPNLYYATAKTCTFS